MTPKTDRERLRTEGQPGQRRRTRISAVPALAPKKDDGYELTSDDRTLIAKYQDGRIPFEDLMPLVERLRTGKAFSKRTRQENWLVRRGSFLRLMPEKLGSFNKRFDQLVNLANSETYEFTKEDVSLVLIYLRTWVDAIEKSFQRGHPLYPSGLPDISARSFSQNHPVPDTAMLSRSGRSLVPW